MEKVKTYDLGKIVGDVPNIQAGTVTMVDGEENAKVEIEGDARNPVLNLKIPRPVFPDKVGDMSAKVYDKNGKAEDVYGYTDKKVKASGYVANFECTKEDNVYNLTNADLPGLILISGVFKAPEGYVKGDKFIINGNEYLAFNADGTVLETDSFVAGAVVPFTVDRENYTINFKSAGSGASLPAEVLLKCFAGEGNFEFETDRAGTYRITCIGKGGDGLEGVISTALNSSNCAFGTGGGVGGAGEVTVKLKKGKTLDVVIDDKDSIVKYEDIEVIRCSAGGKGEFIEPKNYRDAVVTVGADGDCIINEECGIFVPDTAKVFVSNDYESRFGSKVTLDNMDVSYPFSYGKEINAGNGGSYNPDQSKFLATTGGKGADGYKIDGRDGARYICHFSRLSGMPPVEPSPSGFAPFGVGGGGGLVKQKGIFDSDVIGIGGEGGSGAVIIELISSEGERFEPDIDEVRPSVTLNCSDNIEINVGESVTVYAKATSERADAKFTYSWFKDGNQMLNYFNDHFVSQPYITLFDVTEDASGEYMVVVSDGVRASSKKFNITVGDELTNVALNKTYSYAEGGNPETYTDRDNKELTDGIVSQYRWFNPVNSPEAEDYVGLKSGQNKEVIIDFGSVKEVGRVSTAMLSTENSGVRFVNSVEFSASTDGKTFSDAVKWDFPDTYEHNPDMIGIMVADAQLNTNCRYIKVKYDNTEGWTFISEIQAYGKDGEQ